MKTDTSPWPEKRVEALKAFQRDGLSGSQIARALNAKFPGATYSRNAVIAKLDRLKIDMSPGARQATNALARTQRAGGKPVLGVANNCQVFERAPEVRMPRFAVKDPPGLATPDTLGPHMCKWPIGDPLKPGFTFCGSKAERHYCDAHWKRAYLPIKPRQPKASDMPPRALRRSA